MAKAADGLPDRLTGLPAKLRNGFSGEKRTLYIGITAAAVFFLIMAVIFTAAGRLYTFTPALIAACVLTAAAVIFAARKLPAVTAALLLCSFMFSGMTYASDIVNASAESIESPQTGIFRAAASAFPEETSGGKFARIDDIAENIFPADDDDRTSVTERLKAGSTENELFYENAALLYGLPSEGIFNSTVNGNYMRFLKRVGQDGRSIPCLGQVLGYSGKEVLYSLTGTDLLYSKNECPYMYGTSLIGRLPVDGTDYYLYKNSFALPRGTVYDRLMSAQRYASAAPAELPYLMMNEVWLDGYGESVSGGDMTEYSRECGYEISSTLRGVTEDGISCYDNIVKIKEPTKDCFLYISFGGVRSGSKFMGYAEDFYITVDGKTTHTFKILNPLYDFSWVYRTDSYSLTLGYCGEDVSELSFVTPFEYETMSVRAVPAAVYSGAYEARSAQAMYDTEQGINSLTGKVDLSAEGVLCVNVLYSEGWTAYADGNETPVYRANGLFLGIPLSSGHHDIKLVYHTPLIYEGTVLSCVSIAVIIIIAIIVKKGTPK